jgi:radical SAM superfamily enzyme
MYTKLSEHYQQLYGCKVYKLSIDAGFSCPNRDGTIGFGGCIFCSGDGGGEFA